MWLVVGTSRKQDRAERVRVAVVGVVVGGGYGVPRFEELHRHGRLCKLGALEQRQAALSVALPRPARAILLRRQVAHREQLRVISQVEQAERVVPDKGGRW